MPQIVLNNDIASQLRALGQAAELCDLSGHVLGRFVPLIDSAKWEPCTPDITAEELARRSQSTGKRYTTAEVIKHLESL